MKCRERHPHYISKGGVHQQFILLARFEKALLYTATEFPRNFYIKNNQSYAQPEVAILLTEGVGKVSSNHQKQFGMANESPASSYIGHYPVANIRQQENQDLSSKQTC